MHFRHSLLLIPALCLLAACGGPVSKRGDAVTVAVPHLYDGKPGQVRLQWVDEDIVRVSATPERRFSDRPSLMVVPQAGYRGFSVSQTDAAVVAESPSLRVEVDKATGAVRFLDASGRELLSELPGGGKTFTPIEVEGKREYSVRQVFASPDDEAFYGLGQQQTLELNRKGRDEELYQYNIKISVPFVWSTRGYGLLWDSYSWSRWGNPAPYRQLKQVFTLYDKDGVEGALTGTYKPLRGDALVQHEDSLYYENEKMVELLPKMRLKGAEVTYEGSLVAPETG